MIRTRRSKRTALAAALLALGLSVTAAPAVAVTEAPEWSSTWGASPGALTNLGDCNPCSVRNTVHTSVGGSGARVVLSNAMGTADLVVAKASVALPVAADGRNSIPGSQRSLTFGGSRQVTIPAGGSVTSDAVAFDVPADGDVQISMFFSGNAQLSQHAFGTRSTNYVWRGADVADVDAPTQTHNGPYAQSFVSTRLEVQSTTAPAGSVVLIGDSITDGAGSASGRDDRWGDLLFERLKQRPADQQVGVVNAGISGNRILLDGTGPSAISRFHRDVVEVAGAKSVVIFEGINDIRQLATPVDVPQRTNEIVAALTGMAAQAHAAGIDVIGGTIVPFEGYHQFTADREAVRAAVNEWIRTTAIEEGVYDAFVDFDAVIRDPAKPTAMRPDFDSGDHLHPGPLGYAAMANAVDLAALGGYERPGRVVLDAPISIERGDKARLVATVTAEQDVADAQVRLVLPAGWRASQETVSLGALAAGESATASIDIAGWTQAGRRDVDVRVDASLDGLVTSASQSMTSAPAGVRIQAEQYTSAVNGIRWAVIKEATNVGGTADGAEIVFDSTNFGTKPLQTFTVNSSTRDERVGNNPRLEIYLDEKTPQQKIADVALPKTGGWGNYRTTQVDLDRPVSGTHRLIVVMRVDATDNGYDYVSNFDWFEFAPAAGPDLAVDVAASTRTLAGKQYVSAVVTNNEVTLADITIRTPYGSKTFTGVKPGASASVSVNSRLATLPAGEIEVDVTTPAGVDEVLTAGYSAAG